MTLIDILRKKALDAMKAKDGVATTILRLAQSEVQAAEARAGKTLADEEAFAVLRKLVKSNEETIASLKEDDAERAKLLRENIILTELLPKGLSVAEIQALLDAIAPALRAAGNDGQATGLAMKHLKAEGKSAGGTEVAQAVRALRQP